MYIDKITLVNIKSFKNLEFSLSRENGQHAGWTVFTGNNGAGKSTLLKAIAIALRGKEVGRALQGSFNRWVSDGETTGSISLEIVHTPHDDTVSTGGRFSGGNKFPAQVNFTSGSRETNIDIGKPADKPANYQTPQRTIWNPESTGWFSCGYGPFRRVFGASPEATRSMVSPLTESFVTMFQEAASLAEVDSWMRDLNHKTLEKKPLEQAQLALLLNILRDDLLPDGMTIDRVDSDGLWLKDAHGLELAWGEMSDGYRSALALLADIVRHLIYAYGWEHLTTVNSSGKTVINRSGVVLIDEIDAHLHPSWQQKIGFWLKEHFPKIQFLVTTHSPMICQAADPNGIFVLPAPASGDVPRALSDDDYQKVIASRPDTILLTSAFGMQNTRSPIAVEKIAKLSKLKAKQRAGATLSQSESDDIKQLALFVNSEEEV
jgi:energy-coupling factor transporter ATP-binding protein EcfA2